MPDVVPSMQMFLLLTVMWTEVLLPILSVAVPHLRHIEIRIGSVREDFELAAALLLQLQLVVGREMKRGFD